MGRPASIIVVHEAYQQLATAYYQYLLMLGYGQHTCQARYHYLREFLSWLETQGILDITHTTARQINAYEAYLSTRPSKQDNGTLGRKTIYSCLQNIRELFSMLQQEGQLEQNPCSGLKWVYPPEKSQRLVLTQQEIRALFAACISLQERAILSLAYGCGLRVGEMVSCNTEDIRFHDQLLIVPKGKGNKRRVVPISTGVAADLKAYCQQERAILMIKNQKAFMLHSKGGRMQKYTYNKHLKKIVERTENASIRAKNITIHHLRHSIATHLLEQGMRVEQVRLFLGHSQLETTQVYTHISSGQLQKLQVK